jgi:hypothetical protein
MRKRRSISKVVDFKIKPIYFPFFIISYKIILKRGLNLLIFSISSPLLPLHNPGSIIIWPPKISFPFGIMRISVCLLPFHLHFFHLWGQRLHYLGQFIHLRVRHRGARSRGFKSSLSHFCISLISQSVNCQYIRFHFYGRILH